MRANLAEYWVCARQLVMISSRFSPFTSVTLGTAAITLLVAMSMFAAQAHAGISEMPVPAPEATESRCAGPGSTQRPRPRGNDRRAGALRRKLE